MPQDDPGIHVAANDMIRVVIKTKKSEAKPPLSETLPASPKNSSPVKQNFLEQPMQSDVRIPDFKIDLSSFFSSYKHVEQ